MPSRDTSLYDGGDYSCSSVDDCDLLTGRFSANAATTCLDCAGDCYDSARTDAGLDVAHHHGFSACAESVGGVGLTTEDDDDSMICRRAVDETTDYGHCGADDDDDVDGGGDDDVDCYFVRWKTTCVCDDLA